jgi:hypothetical protein
MARKTVQCKSCGTVCQVQVIRTNVPETKPVEFWLCPRCDRKGKR